VTTGCGLVDIWRVALVKCRIAGVVVTTPVRDVCAFIAQHRELATLVEQWPTIHPLRVNDADISSLVPDR